MQTLVHPPQRWLSKGATLLMLLALLLLSATTVSAFTADLAAAPPGVISTVPIVPAAPATEVCSNITTPTTWTLAGSPYVVCPIYVNSGVTLTIEAGVVVKLQQSNSLISVGGALVARGTAEQPIIFTSYQDDSVAGDTNGDSAATVPAPGDWNMLLYNTGARGALEHVIVRYGGSAYGHNVQINTPDVTVADSTFAYAREEGIYFEGAVPPLLARNQFINNGASAVWMAMYSATALTLEDNQATGNAINGFVVNTAVNGPVTWDGDAAFPFVAYGLGVNASGQFTLTPGTVVKSYNADTTIRVYGRLHAPGTADQPIVFTALKDDSAGGDTDNNGRAAPQPGDWNALTFEGASNGSVLDHVEVRYAGHGWGYGLLVGTPNILITNATFAHNQDKGIFFEGAMPPLLANNSFIGNTGPAARLSMYSATSFTLAGNQASGNGVNGFVVNTAVNGNVTWDGDPGLPFVVDSLGVARGAVFTLSPGDIFKSSGPHIGVAGTLLARGTAEAPIYFTSLRDDNIGGDTNGDGSATSPAAGDWNNLRFEYAAPVSGNVLEHAVVRYGGKGWHENIYVANTDLTLRHVASTDANGAGLSMNAATVYVYSSKFMTNHVGVWVGGASNVMVTRSQFASNRDFGVQNYSSPNDVDARHNWWGHSSGPHHPTSNPAGQGDNVTDGVRYDPWLPEAGGEQLLVVPRTGGDNGPVTLTLYAPRPLPATGLGVRLVRAGQPDIAGEIGAVDPVNMIVQATFDLTGQPHESWDVVLAYPDGFTARSPQGFAVVAATLPNVQVELMGRDALRAGRAGVFTLVARNIGNVDSSGALVYLSGLPPDAEVAVDARFVITPTDVGTLPLPPVNRTATETVAALWFNRLAPEVISQLTVTITAPTQQDFTARIDVFSGGAPITPPPAGAAREAAIDAVDKPALNQIWNAMALGPLSNTWITHGATSLATGRSCETAANARAGDVRAMRGGAGSALAGWKVGVVENGLHFVTIVQSPHTGAFYLVDNYVHFPLVLPVYVRNPTETNPAKWVFELKNEAYWKLAILPFNFLYFGSYRPSEASEWQATPPPAGGCCTTPSATRTRPVTVVAARDPNEKIGPVGFGQDHVISSQTGLNYAIYFENVMTATAPAQTVVITDWLDATHYDLTTFALGAVMVGGRVVAVPPAELTDYAATVDLRPGRNLLLGIEAWLNTATQVATWRFTSLDPATGLPTDDPLAGFLPPNVNAPEGEGAVFFTVAPHPGLAAGVTLANQATIVFDENEPLATNEWRNLLDTVAPTSQVATLPPTQASATFTVTWSGSDAGSGIDHYALYVAADGGAFTPWLLSTPLTAAQFYASGPGVYAFASIATDRAGNVEATAPAVEATTEVISDVVDAAGVYLPWVIK